MPGRPVGARLLEKLRLTAEIGRGRYLVAATFGNVHGTYAPGSEVLRPEILEPGNGRCRPHILARASSRCFMAAAGPASASWRTRSLSGP